jgi:DNA repair exonuclease SbcCD ATPase subunit
MKTVNGNYDQVQAKSIESHSCMRLMCSGNENEVEAVKSQLLKAGIPAEARRHPIAEAFGVSGAELWVENEHDFHDASKVYAHLKPHGAKSQEAPEISREADTSGHSVSGPKEQPQPSSARPQDIIEAGSRPIVQPSVDLKHASSLLQKGIEEMFLHESELVGECASLRGKIEKLTQALAQAQNDIATEIKTREEAERNQAQQVTGLLDSIARERWEWQEKLKSNDDAFKNAKEQVTSLSRMLQAQQAAGTALKQELAAFELQREQQQRCLADARKEADTQRQARVAAEERAGVAEQALDTQWLKRQELERQIQDHAVGLSSLLARMTSKGTAASDNP